MMLMITGTFRASGLSLAPSNTIIIRRMDCRLRLRAQSSSSRSVEEPSGSGAWRMSITAVLMEHPSSWQLCAGVTTDKPRYTHNNTHNNTDTTSLSILPLIELHTLQSDVCCHSHTSTDQKITETQHVFRRKSHASDQIWTLYQTRTSQAQTQPENHSFTCNFLFFL